MEQSAGQHVQGAIFAAGPARQRVVRAAVAGGIALLLAWLIALALGVLGGFDSLPVLPKSHPESSGQRTSQTQRPHASPVGPHVKASTAKPEAQRRAVENTSPTSSRVTTVPRTRSAQPIQSTGSTQSTTGNGNGYGITRATDAGKPAGSPGNGPGGSGAPGQLR